MASRIRFLIFIFLFTTTLLHSFDEDFWYRYSSVVKVDPNAGLTTFPILDIPGSGIYDGMAGAYTAMSGDSGFLEANPAAASYLQETTLSFFHREWIGDSSVESITYADRKSFFGYGLKAKFLYLPFTAYNEWGERDARAYYTESVFTGGVAKRFFPSYYFSGLSLGISAKALYRSTPQVLYEGSGVGSQSNSALLITPGIMTKFDFLEFYSSTNENTSIGLVVRNIKLADLKDEYLPTEFITALAYSPIRPWTVNFDYIIPIQTEIPKERNSWAVGQTIQFTDFFSIQSGMRILSGNLRIALGAGISFDDLDLSINYTIDATGGAALDKFSTEATLKLGDRGRGDKIFKRNEYYREALKLYSRGELKRALEYFRAAYKTDPTFTPAYESIVLLERELDLVDKMERLQDVR